MSRLSNVIIVGALALPGLAFGAETAAPLARPAPPLAASGPAAPGSPAVRAAENARPDPGGATQPEPRTVPQVSVPLRSATNPADAPLGVGPSHRGGVDDDAARCVALKTKKERADCRTSAAMPAKTPAATAR